MFGLFTWVTRFFGSGLGPRPTPSPAPTPPPPPTPTPTPAPSSDVAQALLDAHNHQRAAYGLPPLRLAPALLTSARRHADVMARVGRLAHEGIGDGSPWDRMALAGYHYAAASENIAWNQPDVASVMAAWMSDAPHRANVLGPYTEMGAAMANAGGGPYWCVDFGTPN